MAIDVQTTEKVELAEARRRLDELADRVALGESRVMLQKNGKTVAVLVSDGDLRRLAVLDERDREAQRILEAIREPFKDVPPEEIEREAERAWQEVKAEMRAERKRAAAAK